MTSTDNTVSELVINKMTQAQYDALAIKSATELYLVPEEVDQTPTSGNTTHLISSDGVYQYVNSICGAILTRLQGI